MVNAAPAIALSVRCAAGRRRKGRRCPSTSRTMVRCRERGLCAMIASCRARASGPHARDARGGSIIGMGARDHFPPTRPFGRAKMFQVRTTLRAREHAPSAHDPSGVHDLFPRGIPLIPLNPAESHLKLVFRSDREPAHVDGRHVGREETGIRVLCRESRWLESDRSRQDQGCLPPSPTVSKARRSAAGSRDRRVCRRLGISRPQHCESRAFAVVSGA